MVTHVSDWTYSLVYPVSMGLGYATIHGFIQRALQKVLGWDDMESLPPAQAHHGKISQCFAQPSAHDLMRQGKKIAGGAERRSKGWILHQGSVSLPDVLDEKLCAGLAIEFVKLLEEDLENPVLGRELSLQEASLAKELCESRYATRAWNEKY